MVSPLITTKLYIPKPRQGLVSRPALLKRLSEGLGGRLTLISASSGYGKTTLMAEWIATQGNNYPVAWISLDEGDNDPVRFLSYLIAALQNVQDGLGQDSRAMMQGAQNPLDTAILSLLVNELSAVPNDFVIVLEDYHVLNTQEIHQMMIFLIEHLPTKMHLVILTRADPHFPLARLRGRGDLTEIRVKDLRFSREDATVFLHEMTGLNLSEENVRILMDRTEGWITGLQLAALSMHGRENFSSLITTFGSGHDYIVDYLIEEVLERQPDNLKMFLLQTSILSRLNGDLCDALTGQHDGEATLEHLEKANLFVSSLGGEYRWYRYHHLFADVMTNRLKRFYPEQIPELNLQAAKWFQQNNLFTESIEHALAANNYQFAAELVENQALALLKEGNLATLLGWLNKFPPEIISERPLLGIASAWVYLLIGKLENIEEYLPTAEKNLDNLDNPDGQRGQIAAIRAYASARLGFLDQAIDQAQAAFELLPRDDFTVRCVVTFVLSGIYYLRQDLPHALTTMEEASRLGEKAGNIHVAVAALSSMGDILQQQGKLVESEKVYYRALQLGTGSSGQPLPITASAYSGLADLRLIQKDFVSARRFVLTGLDLGKKWINTDSQISCYLTLAKIEHFEGNLDEARAALERAKHLAASYQIPLDMEEKINACETAIFATLSGGVDQGMLIVPLSVRELEILQLFDDGLSNQEIADKLIISLGTVKAHSSNIYRKLDVGNRLQAVKVAREMKLVE